MSASFIAVLILMKVLEISAFIFVPWGITRFILSRFHRDVEDLFDDAGPMEHFCAWFCGFVTIIVTILVVMGIYCLWQVNIIWLTALLG
jgi:hypothetical protein